MRAETLHKLVTGLGFERCILAGGSGGARDSMLTTMLYPEMVTKLVVWNIVGGIYGTFVLGSFYIVPSILAVRGTGMDGVVKVQEWRDRIEENPANKQRFLDFDKDEFLKVMMRWLNAFVSKPGQTIPASSGSKHWFCAKCRRMSLRLSPPSARLLWRRMIRWRRRCSPNCAMKPGGAPPRNSLSPARSRQETWRWFVAMPARLQRKATAMRHWP